MKRNPHDHYFIGRCLDFDGQDLRDMIEGSRQITRLTFLQYVDKADIQEIETELGYGPWLRMSNDWHVAYFKSKFRGWPVVYFVWSAIEHIFASPAAAEHIMEE